MSASLPADMVNQKLADLGIPNRFSITSSRSSRIIAATDHRRPCGSRSSPSFLPATAARRPPRPARRGRVLQPLAHLGGQQPGQHGTHRDLDDGAQAEALPENVLEPNLAPVRLAATTLLAMCSVAARPRSASHSASRPARSAPACVAMHSSSSNPDWIRTPGSRSDRSAAARRAARAAAPPGRHPQRRPPRPTSACASPPHAAGRGRSRSRCCSARRPARSARNSAAGNSAARRRPDRRSHAPSSCTRRSSRAGISRSAVLRSSRSACASTQTGQRHTVSGGPTSR